MKLRRRCMQTLGVSIKQLRKKLIELSARILHVQASSKPGDMALVMLSVSTGMDVRGGSHVGGPDDGPTTRTDAVSSRLRARATAHDQDIRSADVQRNIEINYPPIIEHPGGEDYFGQNDRIQLRDTEQYEEILRTCVSAPPNKTVSDAQSPPRYRSRSGTFDTAERLPQPHSVCRLKRNFLKKSLCNNTNNNLTTGTTTSTTTTTTSTTVSLSRLQWKFGSSSSANNVSNLRDETSSQHHHRENI
ncbi:hypothetical protein HCN44_005753 [Aphidius gifuensis]|uniref:Uncharacterized protein n=1 Tax=Aphidius gifuensis TaxID=684658 RepID=A0A835CR68_APHGI|nr:uncharacterized protein LOC122852812 isoform X2 [Aphidius gifuensis]KAF7992972.1 hypothetical protein HCN44_005753 [Aphidius gifuensis]